jgi:hypothetical protein
LEKIDKPDPELTTKALISLCTAQLQSLLLAEHEDDIRNTEEERIGAYRDSMEFQRANQEHAIHNGIVHHLPRYTSHTKRHDLHQRT